MDSAVAENCMHCIQQLGCLKIAQYNSQGDEASKKMPRASRSVDHDISTSDLPVDVPLPDAGESDESEDDCRNPPSSHGAFSHTFHASVEFIQSFSKLLVKYVSVWC
jgi:hypothetical protein